MEKFNIPVIYSFTANFIVEADTAEQAQKIVKEKVKVSQGALLSYSFQIKNWVISKITGAYDLQNITKIK